MPREAPDVLHVLVDLEAVVAGELAQAAGRCRVGFASTAIGENADKLRQALVPLRYPVFAVPVETQGATRVASARCFF